MDTGRLRRSASHASQVNEIMTVPALPSYVGSDQHILNRPPHRQWHRGPAAEAHDQIRAPRAEHERRGELRPDRANLDGLVQERVADAERSGLQRKAIVAASRLDPVHAVAGIRDEHRNARRALPWAYWPLLAVMLRLYALLTAAKMHFVRRWGM